MVEVYTLRDDMVGSNLIRLRNGLKAFDVGDAGDFTKFECYATGETVEPDVIGTLEGLKSCPIFGGEILENATATVADASEDEVGRRKYPKIQATTSLSG